MWFFSDPVCVLRTYHISHGGSHVWLYESDFTFMRVQLYMICALLTIHDCVVMLCYWCTLQIGDFHCWWPLAVTPQILYTLPFIFMTCNTGSHHPPHLITVKLRVSPSTNCAPLTPTVTLGCFIALTLVRQYSLFTVYPVNSRQDFDSDTSINRSSS